MERAKGDFYGTVFREAAIRKSAAVLDLGCGAGDDIVRLSKMGHHGPIIGIEKESATGYATDEKLFMIKDNLRDNFVYNAEIMLGDAAALPLPDNSIDVVIAASILQEVDDVDKALDDIRRVLKNNGRLIIIENRINNKPLHHGYLNKFGEILNAYPPPPFSARFTHEIAKVKMDQRADFKIIKEIKQHKAKNNKPNFFIRTEDDIQLLKESITTYRYDFKPIISPEWDAEYTIHEIAEFRDRIQAQWTSALKWMERDVKRRIRASKGRGAPEHIRRGALICEVIKTEPQQLQENIERWRLLDMMK
jgi:ubiquinone/menaquinone biosynthesis C-methylase UbiE